MAKTIVLVVALSLIATVALAQERQAGPQVRQQSPQRQGEILPVPGQFVKNALEAQFEILSKPETAEKMAAYTRNYYEALVKKGFSKEEALKISGSMALPMVPVVPFLGR